MNGLYGIWCKLCALFNVIGEICTKVDIVVANNELICDKIEQIVGDPEAPCPECAEEVTTLPLVVEAQESTAKAVATTAAIKVTADALKAQFAKSAKKSEATKEVVAARGEV
jgi:hypothetical protein